MMAEQTTAAPARLAFRLTTERVTALHTALSTTDADGFIAANRHSLIGRTLADLADRRLVALYEPPTNYVAKYAITEQGRRLCAELAARRGK